MLWGTPMFTKHAAWDPHTQGWQVRTLTGARLGAGAATRAQFSEDGLHVISGDADTVRRLAGAVGPEELVALDGRF